MPLLIARNGGKIEQTDSNFRRYDVQGSEKNINGDQRDGTMDFWPFLANNGLKSRFILFMSPGFKFLLKYLKTFSN